MHFLGKLANTFLNYLLVIGMGKNILPVLFCSSENYFGFLLKIKMIFDDLSSRRMCVFLPLGGRWSKEEIVALVPYIYLCAIFNLIMSFDTKSRPSLFLYCSCLKDSDALKN